MYREKPQAYSVTSSIRSLCSSALCCRPPLMGNIWDSELVV